MSPCWDLLKPKHVAGNCPVCNQPPWALRLLALSAGELGHLTQLRPVTSTELPREWPCFQSPHLFVRGCILHPCSPQWSRGEGLLWAVPIHTRASSGMTSHSAPGSSRCHEPCTGHSQPHCPQHTSQASLERQPQHPQTAMAGSWCHPQAPTLLQGKQCQCQLTDPKPRAPPSTDSPSLKH